MDTILHDGRVYVTLETLGGETPALTTQEQGKRFDMPVSRGKDLRDTNLRRTIELCMPGLQTLQGLLAYCAAPAPYPFFEGETQKNSRRAKEDIVRIKGREFSPDLKIDTHYRQLSKPQKLVAPQSDQCCTNCHELDNA